MWYRSKTWIKLAEDQDEARLRLDEELKDLSPETRWRITDALEFPEYRDTMMKLIFQHGLKWHPAFDRLFPETRGIYEAVRPIYESEPVHRRERFPRYDPDAPALRSRLMRDIATGDREIGAGEDAIHPELARELSEAAFPMSEYDDYSKRSSGGRILETIPHELLYHATTDMPAVLSFGRLLSRDELSGSSGLGGGGGGTVSLTTSEGYAHTIAATLVWMSRVAKGEISPERLLEDAKNGVGADHPFDEIFHDDKGEWEGSYVAPLMKGTVSHFGLDAPKGEGWTKDGVWIWNRPINDEERRHCVIGMAKRFLAGRASAGGTDDPLFAFVQDDALARIDPAKVGVLTLEVKDRARGYYVPAEMEWRLTHGDALEIVRADPVREDMALTRPEVIDLANGELRRFLKGWK